MLVVCPSGFAINIRSLKTSEANILADAQAQKKGIVLDSILASVYVDTVDPGPYNFPGAPVWDSVLAGDRFYAHMMARVATHGPDYVFTVPCNSCREPIQWEIKLPDMPLQVLSSDDRAAFVAGNKLTGTGPDGKKYTFHLNTGKHEKRAQAILKQNPQSKLTASMIARIDAIEGEVDVGTYINNLDFGAAMAVLDMLDGHDCGVETTIDISCTECGAVNEVELPFAQPSFWAPRKKKTARTI